MSSQINYTWQLRKLIDNRFTDSIGFYKAGKYVIVYSQYANPCEYSISTPKGFGLRTDDIIRSFTNMIKRSIPVHSEDSPKFPYSPPELASEIMKGPMRILFNTIFMTLHDRMKKNDFGYAITNSPRLACKIWALAND